MKITKGRISKLHGKKNQSLKKHKNKKINKTTTYKTKSLRKKRKLSYLVVWRIDNVSINTQVKDLLLQQGQGQKLISSKFPFAELRASKVQRPKSKA